MKMAKLWRPRSAPSNRLPGQIRLDSLATGGVLPVASARRVLSVQTLSKYGNHQRVTGLPRLCSMSYSSSVENEPKSASSNGDMDLVGMFPQLSLAEQFTVEGMSFCIFDLWFLMCEWRQEIMSGP
jgi:hypothetical protein